MAATRSLVRDLLSWFAEHARDLPWRRTTDPYAIWVSEIMLQQTQVKTVIPYWERWLRAFPTVQALAKAPPERVLKLWEGLGYYTRARNLHRAAHCIFSEHAGHFPHEFAAVLALPGIGRYTAGAICSIAFNQAAPVLDGNVTRVLARVAGIVGDPRERKTNERLWSLAEKLVRTASRMEWPVRDGDARNFAGRPCSALNQALMELGATVCTPIQPQCPVCPVRRRCVAFRQQRIAELPQASARVPITPRHFAAFVVVRNGRVFVRQRPESGINSRLWEFPNCEVNGGPADPGNWSAGIFGKPLKNLRPLCTIQHSITRYRMTLEVWTGTTSGRVRIGAGHWLALERADDLPFTSAHRKVFDQWQRTNAAREDARKLPR